MSFPSLLRIGILKLSIVLVCLIILYTVVLVGASEDDFNVAVINVLGPMSLFVVFCAVGYRTIRHSSVSIWTPYVVFIAGCALFYGIGPLVYTLGSDDTLARLNASNLSISSLELLQVNLLVVVGLLVTLFGFYLSTKMSNNQYSKSASIHTFQLSTLAVVFTVTGFIIRYFFSLPYEFGMSGFTLPGSVHSLSYLLALGLALIGFLSVRSGGRWTYLFWIILLPNVFVAVMQFSKSAAIINLILPALGCFLAHQRFGRLFRWGFVAAIMYFSMQPMVLTARSHIYEQTETIFRATLPERLHIIKRYVKGELSFVSHHGSDDQPSWTRLNYFGQLAFAMRLYDQGFPSKTLQNLWIVFIPRVLWPSKPVVIGPGEDFNEIATGRRGSFMGLGIYGDGYWNAGWLGAMGFGILMGIIFGWMSQKTLNWLQTGQFIYLPAILIAFQTALLGPNKFLINGLIAPSILYTAYVILITIIVRLKMRMEIRTRKTPEFINRGSLN